MSATVRPGTRIGVFEIVARVGAGGMGEVYRARDLRLERDVALKILPALFSADADRLARFEREAKLLAALNHPNIAHIHGLEESGPVRALVIEFVDGLDLSELIARKPLPLTNACRIAGQIADALEAAHDHGIVHRDLKPSNIKVRPDGTVKVLDFGLAKVSGHDDAAAESPTITSPANTAVGFILGTAPYMSPEQARGKAVDRRTDIWAFGCVFYEMLTGRPAFHRETTSDTIAAVLEREPDWRVLPPSTPAAIRQLLRRCLEKDPAKRWRDIGDVRLQLDDAMSTVHEPAAAASSRGRVVTRSTALGLLALGAAAAGLFVLARRTVPSSDAGVRRTMIRATADDGVTADPALSRDGTLLAYASDRAGLRNLDIWVQQSSGGAAIQLTRDPVDEREPAFSPDGKLVAFRSEADGGGIYVVPSFGGQQPRLLVSGGRRPRFSPDGATIAYWTGSNVGFLNAPHSYHTFIVPTVGGAPREIGAQMTGARYPIWSRDGQSLIVLASVDASPGPATYDWWVLGLSGGAPVRTGAYESLERAGVTTSSGNIAPDGWLEDRVVFSDFNDVWSIRVGAQRAVGSVERLTFGTNSDGQPSASDSGTIAFSSANLRDHIWSLPIDHGRGVATGAAVRLTNGTGIDARPSMSADGVLLAYNHTLPTRGMLVRNLKTGAVTDVGVEPSPFGGAISPDGRSVAYEVDGGVSIVPSRGGASRSICGKCTIGDWAGDGRETTVVMLDGNGRSHLSLVDVDSGRVRDLTVPNAGAVNRPFLSAGKRLLAFREMGSKGNEVYVGRVPSQGPLERTEWITIVPPEADARPCGWSPDGSLLYFLSARDGTRCLYAQRVDPATGVPNGTCEAVQHFPGARNMWAGQFGVLSTGPADAMRGGSFLYDLADASSNIWMMAAPRK